MAGDRLHASDAGGELLASPAQHRFSHLLYALWHFLRDYFCGDCFFFSGSVHDDGDAFDFVSISWLIMYAIDDCCPVWKEQAFRTSFAFAVPCGTTSV